MAKKTERILQVLLCCTFFIPLIVDYQNFIFPFIVPKIVVLRSVILIMLALFVPLFIARFSEYKKRFTWLHVAVGFFLLSSLVSTFVGLDPYKSFWDNHERMLGVFTLIHLCLYFWMASLMFSKWSEWNWILRIFMGAGALVMLGGVYQLVDSNWMLNGGDVRVRSTLGNSIYVSAYGVFIFCMSLLLFFKEKVSGWRIFLACTGFLGLVGMFLGRTRGTFVALFLGLILGAVLYAILYRKNKYVKIASISFLGLFVLLTGLVYAFRTTAFVSSLPIIDRMVTLDLGSGTANTRILAWGAGWKSFIEYPLFGLGPNNYFYGFNKHYPAEILKYGWGETWFDNAHNIFVNTLATQGIFGILSYVSIYVVAFLWLLFAYRAKRIDTHLFVIPSVYLLIHSVENFFVFENPTSYMYFFLFLGMVSFLIVKKDNNESLAESKKPISMPILITSLLLGLLFVYMTDIRPAYANMATLKAVTALRANPNEAEILYKKALSYGSPHTDDIRVDFARQTGELLSKYAEAKRMEDVKRLFALAESELVKNYDLHPLDIRNNIQHGYLLQQYYGITKDVEYLKKADTILDRALEISPKRQQLQYMSASIKVELKNFDEAIRILRDSVNEYAPIQEGWWRLALTYYQKGDSDAGLACFAEAESKGVDLNDQNSIAIKNMLLGAKVSSTPSVSDTQN